MLSRGTANRKIGSHQLNMESSRSHSIATVYCETGGGETGKIPCFGKVSFVDLAGSERVKDTKTQGGMLKETSAINRSLFTLGKARISLPSHITKEGSSLHALGDPMRTRRVCKIECNKMASGSSQHISSSYRTLALLH